MTRARSDRGLQRECFEHELAAETEGKVPVALREPGRAAWGSTRSSGSASCPHHTVWRMLGEGTYALGMEPSTNRDAGR